MVRDRDSRPDRSRRSFLRTGAITSGLLGLGASSVDGVAAQNDEPRTSLDALIANESFRPGALFRVISPPLEQQSVPEEITTTDGYAARRVEYLNSDEERLFFPAQDAAVQEGELYRFQTGFQPVEGTIGTNVISVTFETFPETTGNNDFLVPGEDPRIGSGGGKALVTVNNFTPGALILVTTGIIDVNPMESVQESGIVSDYNSYLVEFLNTGDDFFVYAAHEAEIQEGAVYVMRDEFDITEPEGNLVTIDLKRVHQDDVPTHYQ